MSLPNPPVYPDLDLRTMPFMPLDVVTLRDSDIAALATGDEFRAAVLLWCAAWHQVPASSLPADDANLARYAGYGRDIKGWLKVKEGALRGFIECSDGRLYHPVIAEKATETDSKRRQYRERTAKATEKLWGKAAVASNVPHKERRSRRLSEARAKGKHTAQQWEALVSYCGGRCLKCGADDVCKDHIVPIYQGGSDGIDNLQPICSTCNSRKGSDTTDLRPDGWEDAVSNATSTGVQTPRQQPSEGGVNASKLTVMEGKVNGGGGDARASAPTISEAAYQTAKDLLKLWKLDDDEPRMHGLPYYVQGWMNGGAELLFIMSKCANLSPKNLAYLNAAMMNAIEERKTEPLAKPEGSRNVRTSSQTSGSIADAARQLGAAGATFGPRPGGPRLVPDGTVVPLLSKG